MSEASAPSGGGPVGDGGDDAGITLWHAPLSRSMRVLWLLHELELPFKLNILDISGKQLREAEYAGIHPVGRAPAMKVRA